jgi:hypothetical protein
LNSIGNPEMEKETGIQIDRVTLNNNPVMWLNDQAANADVTFPHGTWTLIFVTTDWGAGNCLVQIGDYEADGDHFNAFNSSPAAGSYSDGIITVTVTTDGVVRQNHYLALSIVNASGLSQTIITEGDSYLAPPEGSPDYPLPEMAAGLLLGLGLAGITGFVVIRRGRGFSNNKSRD